MKSSFINNCARLCLSQKLPANHSCRNLAHSMFFLIDGASSIPGDGLRETEGVFISRIALESAVYNSGLLRVGDEILAVNLVDVRHMSLDDVVIIMSIPRRLVLTIRSRIYSGGGRIRELTRQPQEGRPPVVVIKKVRKHKHYFKLTLIQFK